MFPFSNQCFTNSFYMNGMHFILYTHRHYYVFIKTFKQFSASFFCPKPYLIDLLFYDKFDKQDYVWTLPQFRETSSLHGDVIAP